MSEDEIIRERFRSMLKFLEIADHEAVKAKRQLELIFGADATIGETPMLLPCRLEIDDHVYRAVITQQHRDFIILASQGRTLEELLDVILTELFEKGLYTAAQAAIALLIMVLRRSTPGSEVPAVAGFGGEGEDPQGAVAPVGGCQFTTNCREPFARSVCITQGGTPVTACAAAPPPGGDTDDDGEE